MGAEQHQQALQQPPVDAEVGLPPEPEIAAAAEPSKDAAAADGGGKPRVTCAGVALKVWRCALDQWFILGLGVAIGFAAAVPQLGATRGYIRAEYSVKLPAIIAIFVISGLGLKTKALAHAAADLKLHLLIQGLSLGLLPLLGYAVARGLRASGFNPHLADGLVVMACMPTTVSTNVVYTQKAAGNEAASLVNAVLGNIVGIFITPAWLSGLLDVRGAAPYTSVLVELTYTVIAPLAAGQALQYLAPRAAAWIKAHINTANVSSFCILLLVWITFCNTFAGSATKSVAGGDAAALVFLNVALFLLFCAVSFVVAWPPPPLTALRRLARMTRPDVVAVVICGSTKTVALGVPLINVLYKDVPYAGLLALPLIIYHALQVLLGGLMLTPLRRWCLAPQEQQQMPQTQQAGGAGRGPNMLQRLMGRCGGASSSGGGAAPAGARQQGGGLTEE